MHDETLRFAVIWDDIAYDLISIFKTPDESICVVPCLKDSNVLYGIKEQTVTSQSTAERPLLRVGAERPDVTNFNFHKTSFHPSGIIHATDKDGKRIKQYDGRRGFAFNKIDDWITLFGSLPTLPSRYRESNRSKPTFVVDIQKFGFVPCQITCYLSTNNFSYADKVFAQNNEFDGALFEFENYLPSHQLNMYIKIHKAESNFFPAGHIYVYIKDTK